MIYFIILIIAVLIVLCFSVIYYENRALSLTKYTITSERLPKGADGSTFVMLADLHSNVFGRDNIDLIRKIDELAPDYIIIAGDLFIAREYRFDVAYELLTQLAGKYEVFYSFGNHEQKVEEFEAQLQDEDENGPKRMHDFSDGRKIKTFAEFMEKVKALGVIVLDNKEAIKVYQGSGNVRIFGGIIDLDYFKRFRRPGMDCNYLNSCFGECDREEYQILIAHNPMYFDTYAKWGADLVLSGHVHGGMVRLPFLGGVISPQMEIFPKYDAGLFTKKSKTQEAKMIVSRGLGIHTFKIRLWNRPELIHVTLRKNS